MTDALHLLIYLVSLSLIGVGLWWVAPAACLVGVGAILLWTVVCARFKKPPTI